MENLFKKPKYPIAEMLKSQAINLNTFILMEKNKTYHGSYEAIEESDKKVNKMSDQFKRITKILKYGYK